MKWLMNILDGQNKKGFKGKLIRGLNEFGAKVFKGRRRKSINRLFSGPIKE